MCLGVHREVLIVLWQGFIYSDINDSKSKPRLNILKSLEVVVGGGFSLFASWVKLFTLSTVELLFGTHCCRIFGSDLEDKFRLIVEASLGTHFRIHFGFDFEYDSGSLTTVLLGTQFSS